MLVKRVNSHPGSKVAKGFCSPELLTQHCKHAFARCSWRNYTNKHTAFPLHLQPDPLHIYLPNLAPAPPPSKKAIPSAHAHPDNKNMTIHTLRAGEENQDRVSSGQLAAGHTLCTSKNVRWFVGSSPSHLHFLLRTFDCD